MKIVSGSRMWDREPLRGVAHIWLRDANMERYIVVVQLDLFVFFLVVESTWLSHHEAWAVVCTCSVLVTPLLLVSHAAIS